MGLRKKQTLLDEITNNPGESKRHAKFRSRRSRIFTRYRRELSNDEKKISRSHLFIKEGASAISERLSERLGPPKLTLVNDKQSSPKIRKGTPVEMFKKESDVQYPPESNDSIVLEISNINLKATPQDVEAVLSFFGEIVDFVVFSGNDAKFKGSVRVTFKNKSDGINVIKKLNGQVADGRILSVSEVEGISIAGMASLHNHRNQPDTAKVGVIERLRARRNSRPPRFLFEKALIASGGTMSKSSSNSGRSVANSGRSVANSGRSVANNGRSVANNGRSVADYSKGTWKSFS